MSNINVRIILMLFSHILESLLGSYDILNKPSDHRSQVKKKSLVGKSDHITNRIQEYANAGIDHFFLAFQDPFDTKSPRSFADVIDILIIFL